MTESNAQTRALADLAYEIDQLRGAYAHLVDKPADKVIRNALIESFATHARCLLEFFSGIRKSVRATVYTDLDYKLLSVEQVRSWHARISNQRVSHLQVGRPTDDLKKIDATDLSIIQLLEAEIERFKGHLKREFVPMLQCNTQPVLVEALEGKSLTTHISSITGPGDGGIS